MNYMRKVCKTGQVFSPRESGTERPGIALCWLAPLCPCKRLSGLTCLTIKAPQEPVCVWVCVSVCVSVCVWVWVWVWVCVCVPACPSFSLTLIRKAHMALFAVMQSKGLLTNLPGDVTATRLFDPWPPLCKCVCVDDCMCVFSLINWMA